MFWKATSADVEAVQTSGICRLVDSPCMSSRRGPSMPSSDMSMTEEAGPHVGGGREAEERLNAYDVIRGCVVDEARHFKSTGIVVFLCAFQRVQNGSSISIPNSLCDMRPVTSESPDDGRSWVCASALWYQEEMRIRPSRYVVVRLCSGTVRSETVLWYSGFLSARLMSVTYNLLQQLYFYLHFSNLNPRTFCNSTLLSGRLFGSMTYNINIYMCASYVRYTYPFSHEACHRGPVLYAQINGNTAFEATPNFAWADTSGLSPFLHRQLIVFAQDAPQRIHEFYQGGHSTFIGGFGGKERKFDCKESGRMR
ncbi:uncharacterized protein LAESUDRAFT_715982 [Laetiporus sulphureus 93-53]|uniref:Uncharacterized protein n=1 Tax=Laetiporus sulphureus 93-53 TaxID=1314785 RepID=A0A165CZS3_9APHY|nr:uncharacterized protein LAESUDRAFT_715982 [Laetiporus sulphureus 93-53]KZT03840.1 hypothetical protein LAESUDRAFT_715982 [Laetiporus sulphureus 93-53]